MCVVRARARACVCVRLGAYVFVCVCWGGVYACACEPVLLEGKDQRESDTSHDACHRKRNRMANGPDGILPEVLMVDLC